MSVDAIPPSSGGSSSSGGSGGLTLLGTYPATGAFVNIVTRNAPGKSGAIIQSDYSIYQVELENIQPTTSGDKLGMRWSSNGGSSYISSANYYWADVNVTNVGGPGRDGISGDAQIQFFTGGGMSTTVEGLCLTIKMWNPGSVFARKSLKFDGVIEDTGAIAGVNGYGVLIDSGSMNAFQFFPTLANVPHSTLASGTFYVYGLPK